MEASSRRINEVRLDTITDDLWTQQRKREDLLKKYSIGYQKEEEKEEGRERVVENKKGRRGPVERHGPTQSLLVNKK